MDQASTTLLSPDVTGQARLVSLDVLRGLVVAGMILVTDPGTYSAIYWPLRHSDWNGWTPTDIISPGFLIVVGMATTFSLSSRMRRGGSRTRLALHALRRSVVLLLLGLLINGLPDFNLHTLRIPGILQHIGICYLVASLLYLFAGGERHSYKPNIVRRSSVTAGVLVFCLAVYWALLKLYPVPGFGPGRLDTLGNLSAYVDRTVFGVRHLWVWGLTPGYGVTFDPDGLLSTLGTLAITLMGLLAGEWLLTPHTRTRKVAVLAACALVLMLAGRLMDPLLPLNKKMWTSTFALFSGGISLLVFCFFYLVLDIKRWLAWAVPVLVLGTNAIFAFVFSSVLTTLSDQLHIHTQSGTRVTAHRWLYQQGLALGLSTIHASLLYAVAVVLLNIALVYPLYRRRIFLRI